MNDSHYQHLSNAWKELSSSKHVLISTHLDPDGDAIGSALGLYHLLKDHGVSATIINQHPVPKNLTFLPESHIANIRMTSDDITPFVQRSDAWCILDLNAPQRLGPDIRPIFEAYKGKTFVFDHHVEPTIAADNMHVITIASSTCEIIARMALLSDILISSNAAQCLYTGIMTDTGGFRHPRTNADVMRLAATLIEAGADPVSIYDHVMNANSLSSMILLGRALSNLRIEHDGKLVLMILRMKDLAGYSPEELEGFVNYTLSISGAKIGGLLTEWADGTVKMSLRAKPEYEVRSITEHFGGGGHMQAAGARVRDGNMDQIIQSIIELSKTALHTS